MNTKTIIWYKHELASVLENEMHKVLWDKNKSSNLSQKTRSSDMQKKKKKKKKMQRKKDHKVKLKESEKRTRYLKLAREQKKQWNMKGSVTQIIISVLGLVKGLEEFEIRGQVETIQTIALLRSARILRKVLETSGNLLSLKLL